MDTFRADHLGARDASGHSLTPSLDAFATESVAYARAFSQSNETLFSHTALFTGQNPSHWGDLSYFSYRLPTDTPTLAAMLSRAGYHTEAVVAGGHLSPGFGLTAGFQRYQSMQDFSSFQETVPRARERLAAMAEAERPFLLFVHGYDAHSPYVKPGVLFRPDTPGYSGELLQLARNPLTVERIRHNQYYPDFQPGGVIGEDGRDFLDPEVFTALEAHAETHTGQPLTDADIAFLQGAYDAAVRNADFFVGVLLQDLAAMGLAEQTTVVILSDHGEELLEHGFFNHRFSLHDESTHVPLLIRTPGQAPGVVTDPVALTDVLPSLLSLAGLTAPSDLSAPLSAGTDPDRLVYSESMRGEQSWRSRDGRLIARDDTVQWIGGEYGAALSPEAEQVLRQAHEAARSTP
jgi:arylsulfatase A-like enzyme